MEPHDKLATEEATKNALIMPFTAALVYDAFDSSELVPEHGMDASIKKADRAVCDRGARRPLWAMGRTRGRLASISVVAAHS